MASDQAINRTVNKWAAIIIPFILVGLAGYVTWVIVVLIAVHYLLNPLLPVAARHGAAIAVIAVYFILFALFAISYLRVIQVVTTNPGYVLRPTPYEREKRAYESKGFLDRPAILDGRAAAPPGLGGFNSRDVYECEVDGLPRWCTTCKIWKYDRSHHCSESDRCVYKMDHYCPWAGGIISETSFKFFVQFCTYSAIYCLYMLIVGAHFTSELKSKGFSYNVHWIVATGISGLFFLFSVGVAINSFRFVFTNSTTVDDLTHKTRIMHVAVLMLNPPPTSEATLPFATITYPLGHTGDSESASSVSRRTYAILQSSAGTNPYLLSSRWSDFKSVMGYNWYEWFLPLQYSPCYKYRLQSSNVEGDKARSLPYKFGPVLGEMKRSVGLYSDNALPEQHGRRRRRRRKHRRSRDADHSDHNGVR